MRDSVSTPNLRNGLFARAHNAVIVIALVASAQYSHCTASSGSSPAPLLTAASVLALNSEQATYRYPVRLQGVVTFPNGSSLVLQDGTAGIWVNLPEKSTYKLGDLLEVRGTVGPGGYSPEIWASSARRIGQRALPLPKDVAFRELSSGIEDDQYISVIGKVRSVRMPANHATYSQIWIRLAMQDGFVDATLPNTVTFSSGLLLDSEVRVNAVALCSKNRDRQLTSVVLGMSSLSQITIVRPPDDDPFARPLTPLSALMQYRSGTDYYHRLRIAGVVTYYDPARRLILEDGDQAILVTNPPSEGILLGDRVEVSGFIASETSGPFIEDATVRFVSHGVSRPPAKVSISDILSGESRYRLVSVEGHVVSRVEEPWGVELLVQSGSSLLQAELHESARQPSFHNLQDGTKILLTGINMVEVEGKWDFAEAWVHCKLLLRSENDVQVLQLPSWWTTSRVIYLATILGLLILLLLGLVVYSLIARWKLQIVFKERERMAHEIHDTMAQSFAGIGFQLQAILRAIPEGMHQLQQEVALARDLVRHSHREARRSFSPLESELNGSTDLLTSLESSAKTMVTGGTIAITSSNLGVTRAIPPQMANELLRIGQEAIANAVRHADPCHLDIVVHYASDSVTLSVQDDGVGFVKSGSLLGFGLRGMRKRAASISAKLEIESNPGHGTRIEVIAPLRSSRKWRFFSK